jgi:RNA polymerase sigma factor (sigma-70 family)
MEGTVSISTEVLEDIIKSETDPARLAQKLVKARDKSIAKGFSSKTVEQGINDILGWRKVEAEAFGEDDNFKFYATVLFLINEESYVSRAVRRFNIQDGTVADLKSSARVGLWKAAQTFKPGSGSFFNYADRGMSNEVRTQVASDNYSTYYEWRHRPAVQAAASELRSHGMKATPERISLMTELSVPVIKRILDPMTTMSVDDEENPSVDIADTTVDMAASLEAAEFTNLITTHINALNDIQRQVINALYNEQLTQKEAAKELGITANQVANQHAAALAALKASLTSDDSYLEFTTA